MCDDCDCRSHPPIADLAAEHEAILERLDELDVAVFAVEESDLFPVAHQLLSPAGWDAIDAISLESTFAPHREAGAPA